MPEEAVKWLDRMIDYTVAGGKMNRGLAMMSAYKTLLNSKGIELTIKVTETYTYIFFPVSLTLNTWKGPLPIGRIGLVHRVSAGLLSRR
jgi:hypothetical protein